VLPSSARIGGQASQQGTRRGGAGFREVRARLIGEWLTTEAWYLA